MFQLSSVFVSPQVHVGVAVPSLYLLFQPIDIIMQTSETPRFTRIRRVSSSFHPVSISPTRKQKVLVPVSARTTSPRRPPYSFDPNPRLGTIYIRT